MDRHVMLLFLSDVKINRETKQIDAYTYDGIQGECETTNESAVRYLVQNGFNGQKPLSLSKIYVFVTDKVSRTMTCRGDQGVEEYRDAEGRTWTHAAYFRHRIEDIVPHAESIVDESPYDENAPVRKAVDAVVEMAGKIQRDAERWQQESGGADSVYLHVDCTGGLRHANMMMLAIIRLMQYNGVKIGKILYSNFSAEPKKVEEANDIYNFFDLISGTEEFVRFGSVSAIQDYYADKDTSPELSRLLAAMDRFAEAIKLCHYDVFTDAVRELRESIRYFRQDKSSSRSTAVMMQLQQRIYDDYQELLQSSGEVSDLTLIRWCLDHDYLQQALTLYTERVPEIMGKYGLVGTAEKGKELFAKIEEEESLNRSRNFLIINEYIGKCMEQLGVKPEVWQKPVNKYLRRAWEKGYDAEERAHLEETLKKEFDIGLHGGSCDTLLNSLTGKVLSLLDRIMELKENPKLLKDIEAAEIREDGNVQFLLKLYRTYAGEAAYQEFRGAFGKIKCKELKKAVSNINLTDKTYEAIFEERFPEVKALLAEIDEKKISVLRKEEYVTISPEAAAEDLDRVYNRYMNLKRERNNSNHAKERSSDRQFDAADELKQYMTDGVCELEGIIAGLPPETSR